MIAPGKRVAVACSGGPDSTALLLILEQLAPELGCALAVTHFNHRLRGPESDQDEQFVRNLSEQLGLRFFSSSADTRQRAAEAKANIEKTARQLRYDYFTSLVESGLADLVSVGHTADDQAETVLHRLLRGTGSRGLAGIHPTLGPISGPMLGATVVRPLIEINRKEVHNWLRACGQVWREDPSNQDLRFVRNRIRHQLLPALAEFNPSIVKVLTQSAEIARDEERFWDDYLRPFVDQHLRGSGGVVQVDITPLKSMPTAVARRFLRYALEEVVQRSAGGGLRDRFRRSTGAADFLHVQQVLGLALSGQSGTALALPGDIVVRKEFSALVLEKAEEAPSPFSGYSYEVTVPETVEVPEIPSCFAFELIALASGAPRYNGSWEDLLDSRVIGGSLVLRNWQAGDSYRQRGHRKSRKIKELFQRWRVSSSMRERWPVVVADHQIVWSRRGGVAEGFAPRPESSEALRIRELDEPNRQGAWE